MSGPIIPAGPPPLGVISNFVDPVNKAPNLIACNVVLLVASIIIVGARILSRTVLTDWRLGWDDYTIILSLIGTAIFSAFVITSTCIGILSGPPSTCRNHPNPCIATHFGLGRHMWDVPKPDYTPHYLWVSRHLSAVRPTGGELTSPVQWIMATFAACPASYYFVKLSILFFYLRVFDLQAKLRYIIYAMFVYCTIYYGVAFFAIIALCNIKNRAWDITVTMNCFAYGKLTFAIGGLDLVADVIVLVFPIPQVLKLQISWAQKVYLLVIFLFGLT
ncbi:MAG: hypothetical protein Q9207_007648 [Kuettlingeria erythrocarpa]